MRTIRVMLVGFLALVVVAPAHADRRGMDAWAESASNGELVDALVHDDVRWNALVAQLELIERGDDAVPQLELALRSEDWQQRQLAASLLRRVGTYQPSDSMLVVCVEGLANDRLPFDRGSRGIVSNATEGTLYLIRHVEQAEGYVAAGLHFDDAQQRFFCAYILGMTSRGGYAGKICEILAPHLNDNSISGDAVLATRALYLTGPAVIPHLDKAARKADAQGRSLLELVILDLRDPPETLGDLYERGEITDVTGLVHDPAYEDVDIRMVVPFRGTSARE